MSVAQPAQDDKASIRCETSPPSTPRSTRLNKGGHAASHEDIRDLRRYSDNSGKVLDFRNVADILVPHLHRSQQTGNGIPEILQHYALALVLCNLHQQQDCTYMLDKRHCNSLTQLEVRLIYHSTNPESFWSRFFRLWPCRH